MPVSFLKLADILAFHEYQIERYGGATGIRDWNLLHSAAAMPAATFGGQFLHADLFEMAGAYLFHLVQGHPFIDGNERVGAAAAATFLEYNGFVLTADPDDYAELVLAVARGEIPKSAIADFFRANVEPL